MPLRLDYDLHLCCPLCGESTGTHVDGVIMAARRKEDGPFTYLAIADTGWVGTPYSAPQGDAVGVGRRHRIALIGTCEHCGDGYAIIFTQHKGSTFVETVPFGHGGIQASDLEGACPES